MDPKINRRTDQKFEIGCTYNFGIESINAMPMLFVQRFIQQLNLYNVYLGTWFNLRAVLICTPVSHCPQTQTLPS
jgi:hypothetical protein